MAGGAHRGSRRRRRHELIKAPATTRPKLARRRVRACAAGRRSATTWCSCFTTRGSTLLRRWPTRGEGRSFARASSCERQGQRHAERASFHASARGRRLFGDARSGVSRRLGPGRHRLNRRRSRPGQDSRLPRRPRDGDAARLHCATVLQKIVHRWRDRQRVPDVREVGVGT
jgi:hypothetical protein